MTDKLYNDIHINAVLVMLPYDADKVAKLNVGLEINGKPAAQCDLSSNSAIKGTFNPNAQPTVSFLDADKKRVYYKLIADSDADVKPKEYSVSHDAAAYVEVDASGHEIKNTATDKPHVIVTFPGANDLPSRKLTSKGEDLFTDFADGSADLFGGSSYHESFFNNFMERLKPQLTARGMTPADVQAIGHSSGDKYAAEYAARYNAKNVMVIDGWDKKDGVIGAAMRHVLRENQDKKLSEEQFNTLLAAKIQQICGGITEINPGSKEAAIGATAYEIPSAGHKAKYYLNLSAEKVVKIAGVSDTSDLYARAHSNAGLWGGTQQMEEIFENTVMDEWLRDPKFMTATNKAIILGLDEKLNKSGIQIADMQEAAKLLFRQKPSPDIGR